MFDELAVNERIARTHFPRLRYVRETESTNDDAARELGNLSVAGTLILAEYQRHGRGRRGRRWVAPPGSGLLFTAILPKPLETTALWAVPFWCALTVADGVSNATTLQLQLQWPNDLLLGAGKVCGILSISRVTGETAWAACGVGINVYRPSDGAEADAGATYIAEAAPGVSREELFVAIVRAMDARLSALRNPRDVARSWESRAGLPGTRYRLQIDGETSPFEGAALRLGDEGELVVATDCGERRVALGDARVLRAKAEA